MQTAFSSNVHRDRQIGPLRVVQWATGNIGTRSLEQVIDHPRLELVGVAVHDQDKLGRDAGELCGRPPVGIRAVGDVDEVLALQPDCVIYSPRRPDADTLCRLLAAGIDVVSTCGQFHHPPSMDPALRERVEAACAQGGASIHSTGSGPGFITEAVPLVLASIQRRLDRLTIHEFADLSRRPSPGLLFEVMGFGAPPTELDERRVSHGVTSFGPSLRLVADALGVALDEVVSSGEVAVTPSSVTIAAGTLDVCAAAPGIRASTDLPPIVPELA